MGKTTTPRDADVIKEKLDKGEVKAKVKGTRKPKNTKSKGVKGNNGRISDDTIVAYLENQDKPVTSTQLRDHLAFKSRTQARRVMRRLVKAGKVSIGTHKISDKRSIFVFSIIA